MRTVFVSIVVVLTTVAVQVSPARGECNCVSVASSLEASVDAKVRAEVMRADGLYARGDFAGALALYAKAHAATGAGVLLYAQAMSEWQLGRPEARAHFAGFVAGGAGGEIDAAFRARSEAALSAIDSGVTRALGGIGAGATAAVADTADLGGVLGGEVRGQVDRPKPKKIAKGAAIVLGVVAVAAVTAVAVHGIVAARADDVDFDTKFGVGLGLSGAIAGGSAIYLWGLTAATGAAGGGVGCGVATRF